MNRVSEFFSERALDDTFNYLYAKYRLESNKCDPRGISFAEFIHHRGRFLSATQQSVLDGTYNPATARPVYISADKPRLVYQFEWIDRFWMDHLARFISSRSELALSDSVYSFRRGRSPAMALKRLQEFIRANTKNPIYVLRRDIQNYGPSMRHEQILASFDAACPDAIVLRRLLSRFCCFQYFDAKESKTNAAGLPAGSYLQTVFDNLYLSELDAKMLEFPEACYLRFGDDIIVGCTSLEQMRELRALMARELALLGLTPHPDKCADLVLSTSTVGSVPRAAEFTPAQHFEYLGIQVDHHGLCSLPRRKSQEIRTWLTQRLRNLVQQRTSSSDTDDVISLASSIIRSAFSERSDLRSNPLADYVRLLHDDQELRRLDQWLALHVLKLATGKKFRRSNFRRVPLSQLRKLGLPSMVHLSRTGWRLS